MKEYIEREAAINELTEENLVLNLDSVMDGLSNQIKRSAHRILASLPAADVVPWEWLELYADYFWAGVSMPEFVREAKMFYESSNKAMQGGVIDG